MPMLVVGLLLLIGRWADIGPMGRLPWWGVALPFVLAAVWWQIADSSGLTKRRAMEKMEQRKVERREKAMDALGLGVRRERHKTQSRQDAARRSTVDPTQREHAAEPPGNDQRP